MSPRYLLIFLALAGIGLRCKDANSEKTVDLQRVEAAISCTKMGLTPADSVLYMQGGGSEFQPTKENSDRPTGQVSQGMVWIPGGEFSMGSPNPRGMADGGREPMSDARPIHQVYVDGFYMDESEVTNAEFAEFVKATGYVTIAEKKPTRDEFPDAPEENLVAGSVVFTPPPGTVSLEDHLQWWSYIRKADWRHPEGPNSSIVGKENYPVVQIAWEDAAAYAKWAGKRLPTEAEWEFAARGGKTGELYTWGNQLNPDGKWMANVFEGKFPNMDLATDGYSGTAPIEKFEANAYGLFDMAGNVWEWCSDWYRPDYYAESQKKGLVTNPKGPDAPYDPMEPTERKKIQRGGSFLCTDQYCTRYMIGTRGKGEWRSAANHLGFRCVKDYKK